MAITQRNNGDHCFYFYFRPFPPLTRKNYGHVLFRLFAYYVTYLVQRLSTKWRKIAGVSGNDKNRTRDDDGIAWDTRSNAVKIKKKKKNDRTLLEIIVKSSNRSWLNFSYKVFVFIAFNFLSFDSATVKYLWPSEGGVNGSGTNVLVENWVGNKLWNFVILFFFLFFILFFFFFNVWKREYFNNRYF